MGAANDQGRDPTNEPRHEREQSSEELKEGREASSAEQRDRQQSQAPEQQADGDEAANPPRTTTGKVTAPKFGSAGSGGAELEPGPERP